MEKSVQKLSTEYSIKKKNLSSPVSKTSSQRKIIKSFGTQKKVNSWDSSTPSDNEKVSKEILNDWDSCSDIQETTVEAFDFNENLKIDDWDSESEKTDSKNDTKNQQPYVASSLDSFHLSNNAFSGVNKVRASSKNLKKERESGQDDSLLLEDFDEQIRDEIAVSEKSLLTLATLSSDSVSEKVRSKQSEGTPEDTTIWMISKSERTESVESTNKLISSSDIEKIKNLNRVNPFFKKTKSLSDMQKSKIRRRTARSSRSENSDSQKNNYNTFLLCEGSNLQRKLEIESKENILSCEKFHRTRVFFTEFECKAMTIDKDVPGKQSPKSSSTSNANEERLPNDDDAVSDEKCRSLNRSDTRVESINEQPGSSGVAPVSTTSLNLVGEDSTGKLQNGDFHSLKMKIKEHQTNESGSESTMKADMSESWLLFDDAGKYQEISKTEVSMMFNGRSADAVLQGREEHLVPASTLTNTKSLKTLLTTFEPKDSLQHIMKEEDTGGDDEFKRLIDLERKVENTLFYIRPETDFRASIRIIPVNPEMIHLWKRNRDCGTSNLSFDTELSLPRDSTENSDLRLNRDSSYINQPLEETLAENENQAEPPEVEASAQSVAANEPECQQSPSAEFSKLLTETRVIVDTLTQNFRTLQSRLDGETHRSMALQGELSKLRHLVKTYPDSGSIRNNGIQSPQVGPCTSASLLTLKASDKVDIRSESVIEEETEELINFEMKDENTSNICTQNPKTQDGTEPEDETSHSSNVITVNIYTVEDAPTATASTENNQESYSVAQSNLRLIEKKMKRLQQENATIARQNIELKRKLKEISHELEKYLSSSSDQDLSTDEGKELEALREQVANLQQELENLKIVARDQEETLTEENLLIREQFTKSLTSLNDWLMMAGNVFGKVQTARVKLQEVGITVNVNLEADPAQNPKTFNGFLSSYLEQIFQYLRSIKNENFLYEQALKNVQKESTEMKEISSLDQVITGYSELIEQCRKGQITGETNNKVMEDYFAVVMEKASLMEEVKILKTENEMLLESQLEHYEKLKQTMIALKDRKSEITALESSQKLSADEKTRMTEILKLLEEEKKQVEAELLEKSKTVEDLREELKKKDLEIRNCNERLKGAVSEITSFEQSCRLKDEIINKLQVENEELLNASDKKNSQIEILKNEVKNLEMQYRQLEGELTSTKLFLDDSQKEMTDYITHLEALVSTSQESLEKVKQKLKETNQNVNRLKNENDVLEKQHQCDVKLFNNTKDELESCKEKLMKTTSRLRELEEEKEKLQRKYDLLAVSDKEKSDVLESCSKEFQMVTDENNNLREKLELYSKDKEELLSDQKDLINKYGILSKGIQKLQEKYRSVKTECNERTDLIRYLEVMLKDNVIEYNNRIASLEQNISQIIEKIIAYKNGLRGKHSGVDTEVKELRQQLDVTCHERKELENVIDNYYYLIKHLENELQEREKKVDELHVRLSLEQQKANEYENEKSFRVSEETKAEKIKRIELLENQIAIAENDLGECKRELQRCRINHENEKKKLELTIGDLRSEVKRHQLRNEIIMRNLSNGLMDKRNGDDSDLQTIKTQIEEKDRAILELNDTLNKYKAEVKLKEGDLENIRKKCFYQNEELKNLQNQLAKLQDAMSSTNKTTESQQKERDEIAQKLFQSIKLLIEERSARQTMESLALEKEKNYKNQIEQIKDELILKVKDCETLSETLEDKKKLIITLQDDLKKMKAEMATLKAQVSNYKKRNIQIVEDNKKKEEPEFHTISSPIQLGCSYVSHDRLESCLKELKEIRDLNLELRKLEGQFQAKIVCLEDEIRDARLLIKELQGDIKTEKKSKKAMKNMILAAKMEIEKCVMAKQLMSVVAEKISRHLDLSKIPSRELFSGFRLGDSSSIKICTVVT